MILGAELSSNNSSTPLHWAAMHGDTNTVKKLLNKANVNEKDEDDDTPLHLAAMCGHAEIVQMSLEAGASLNEQDNDGDTPLHLAMAYGHTEIAQILLNAGASLDAQDNDGNTPLLSAASSTIDAVTNLRYLKSFLEIVIHSIKDKEKFFLDFNQYYGTQYSGAEEITEWVISKEAETDETEKEITQNQIIKYIENLYLNDQKTKLNSIDHLSIMLEANMNIRGDDDPIEPNGPSITPFHDNTSRVVASSSSIDPLTEPAKPERTSIYRKA